MVVTHCGAHRKRTINGLETVRLHPLRMVNKPLLYVLSLDPFINCATVTLQHGFNWKAINVVKGLRMSWNKM